MVHLLSSIMVISIIYLLNTFLSFKSSSKGFSPFESGFSPMMMANSPFSLHFFLLGLLFVLFDLEIILLFPFVVSFSILTWVFCMILLLGLFYEWNLGTLNWI